MGTHARLNQPRVLALILAGGKGERLMPLTQVRSKPAVPFGGTYRLIDFVLSNFYNSGITAMHVMVQYRSQSLIEHLRRAWRIGGGDRIQAVAEGAGGHGGRADEILDRAADRINRHQGVSLGRIGGIKSPSRSRNRVTGERDIVFSNPTSAAADDG